MKPRTTASTGTGRQTSSEGGFDGVSISSVDSDRGANSSSESYRDFADRDHQRLRAECVRLKMELAKVAAMSKGHAQSESDRRSEVDSLRRENRLLSQECENLRRKLEKATAAGDWAGADDGAQALPSSAAAAAAAAANSTRQDREVIEKLRRLKMEMECQHDLDPAEVANVMEEIRENTCRKLSEAAAERYDLEMDLQLVSQQRDEWKCEAEQLAIELKEVKAQRPRPGPPPTLVMTHGKDGSKLRAASRQSDVAELKLQNNEMAKTIKDMEAERGEWKAMVEQLGIDLNDANRHNDDMMEMMGKKDSEIMEIMNQMNEEMATVVKQKDDEIMGLINYMQVYSTRVSAEKNGLEEKIRRLQRHQRNQNPMEGTGPNHVGVSMSPLERLQSEGMGRATLSPSQESISISSSEKLQYQTKYPSLFPNKERCPGDNIVESNLFSAEHFLRHARTASQNLTPKQAKKSIKKASAA